MANKHAVTQIATRSGAILFDPDRIDAPSDTLFNPEHWHAQGKTIAQAGGRGGVLFIDTGTQRWVLRHYRRGGWMSALLADRYLWRGAEQTRAFREWRLLQNLHAQQLPVPAPIATRYVRSGIWYRADLLTEALPPARTLAETVSTGVRVDAVWRNVGSTLARFHRAGVRHADLNAHNILLGVDAEVWVLDFDRGVQTQRGAWEQQVLVRLHRSLCKVLRAAGRELAAQDWRLLLDAYAAADRTAT
jgi:3-deoxy-D-manno-octulosonic acid kinase